MDPDATWQIITDVHTDPHERRQAALDLLIWYARYASYSKRIETCEAVILAEFDHIDRLEGR